MCSKIAALQLPAMNSRLEKCHSRKVGGAGWFGPCSKVRPVGGRYVEYAGRHSMVQEGSVHVSIKRFSRLFRSRHSRRP